MSANPSKAREFKEHSNNRFFSDFSMPLLGFSILLLLTIKVQAQECSERAIKEYIDTHSINLLTQCRSKGFPILVAIVRDKKVNPLLRVDAIEMWGSDPNPSKIVPYFNAVVKDKSDLIAVRKSAAWALGYIGIDAEGSVSDLQAVLVDKNDSEIVREATAYALGQIGAKPDKTVPVLLSVLNDKTNSVPIRVSAAGALSNFGKDAKEAISALLSILKDKSEVSAVRASAANALSEFGADARKEVVSQLLVRIKDRSDTWIIRSSAAYALSNFGADAKEVNQDLQAILKDESDAPSVRIAVAWALKTISSDAKEAAPALLKILKDKSVSWDHDDAADALFVLGSDAKEIAPQLLVIIEDRNTSRTVRASLLYALGRIGANTEKVAPQLLKIFRNENKDQDIRFGAAYALAKSGLNSTEILSEILATLKDKNIRREMRLDASRAMVFRAESLNDRVRNISIEQLEGDKKELNNVLAVMRNVKDLRNDLEDHEKSVQRALNSLESEYRSRLFQKTVKQWVLTGATTWIAHASFWLMLVFFYPRIPQIQAIFFWNPWVRTILGFGYVSFLLTWIPFLRRKLFAPFRFSLLADAGLNHFHPDTYFSESNVRELAAGDEQAITRIIPEIKGQVILEGDSGLGKTMFLRHLLQQSKRIVVYLPATKCAEGVIEAIQKKLHGDEIKDTKFLQSLIYSGAIDICIDGLNEVNPDTRAKITQFVESHFKGNILMTTQPLEWLPPSTAKTYVMQPLQPEQIERYLLSRQPSLPKAAPVQGKDYEQACRTFLNNMLGAQTPLSPEELKTARTVLSNPMELTLAAWMLADDKQPDLFNLRQQQYEQMAEQYRRTWNQDFPLKQFSEAVYQQWLLDQKALPADKFYNELLCMEDEKFRMVVSRQWKDAKGEAKKEWYFRHDKIAEFFLVQTFLGKGADAEARLLDHIGDSRFRGVYFLLATLMDLEAAKDLREKLIQYAADTKDHTVSDTFVQLLRFR
ncbi:MAG: HEAT repeat domain-containing protein [Lyngbya sp. HA4199-MV5]|jgi:hypothetical protein|nr:HEAT repeat domain-containing protein [Lyngbya sp. HA4199-MV5]